MFNEIEAGTKQVQTITGMIDLYGLWKMLMYYQDLYQRAWRKRDILRAAGLSQDELRGFFQSILRNIRSISEEIECREGEELGPYTY